jgi:DinB family protein
MEGLKDVLEALEAFPSFVGDAARRVDEEAARLPGPGGTFSLVEQAWHLADLEREGYGERIRRLLDEDRPHLPDFDGDRIARERSYRARSLAEGVAAFAAARAENLLRLRSLPSEAWGRTGTQEGVGEIRLEDVPRMMQRHDLSHRREILGEPAAGSPAA